MTEGDTMPISAFSASGKYVAVAAPSVPGRIQVHVYEISGDASACKLHLTMGYAAQEGLKKLVFCGDAFVVGLVGTTKTSIVVWDVTRGIFTDAIEAGEVTFLDLTTQVDHVNESPSPQFHALIGDDKGHRLLVQSYAGALCRKKIKCGKWSTSDQRAASFAISKTGIAVVCHDGVRIINPATGKKTKVIKVNSTQVGVAYCSNDPNTLMVLSKDVGSVVLHSSRKDKDTAVDVGRMSSSSGSGHMEICKGDDGTYTALLGRSVFCGSHSFSTKCTIRSPDPCIFNVGSATEVMSLRMNKANGMSPTTIAITSETPKEVILDNDAGTRGKLGAKRKLDSQISVLGPGQSGVESEAVALSEKRSRSSSDAKDNLEDLPIADRLKQLNKLLDSELEEKEKTEAAGSSGFVPKLATTESLKELLSQGLSSQDASLLKLAFSVRDTDTIETTLKDLKNVQVAQVIDQLTAQIASNPLSVDALSGWLSASLMTGRFSREQLGTLRHLLSERVESLPDLIRLEGRLSVYID